jgi:hypothetical protein
MLKDTGTQGYILHFVTPELMTDIDEEIKMNNFNKGFLN